MEAGGKRRIFGLGDLPEAVEGWLAGRGVQFHGSGTAKSLLSRLEGEDCDAILLFSWDASVLSRIRAAVPEDELLPLVLVSPDPSLRARALLEGADAALDPGMDAEEFGARLLALCRLRRRYAELASAKRELEKLSVTDDLTGLHNKRWFLGRLSEEVSRVERYRDGLALVLFDLDHFKRINDAHGHVFGDEVLRSFASLLRKSFRGADLIARYGGEEFAVILPETPLDGAVDAAERFRAQVEGEKIGGVSITTSAGVAAFPLAGKGSSEDLLRGADEALYRAKRQGRNRVAPFQQMLAPVEAWPRVSAVVQR